LQRVPIRLKALKPKDTDFEPHTLGEHIRKRRLELRLSQGQAASRLNINPWTVLNWEKGHTEAPIESIPAILLFLGYDPFPVPVTLPERMLAKRRAMGWSIREAARHLSIDPSTWRDWEAGKIVLYRKHRIALARFFGLPREDLECMMQSRWTAAHRN